MQNATIHTTDNQIKVNVQTSETRVKDFTFGENNEHHIIQMNEEKENISAVSVNDGLGINETTVTMVNANGNAKLVMTTSNVIQVYVNDILIDTI